MSTDTTPPQLVSISFPEVIDLGDGNVAATFSVSATDNVAMDQAVFWFDSPVGYGFSETTSPGSWSLMIVGGDWREDQASVTRHFAQDHSANAPRTVSLDRIVIEDVNGNSVTYDAQELAGMGLQTSFEFWQGAPPAPDLGYNSSRVGNTLVVSIVNEGDARDGATLSGQISFALDGASYVSTSAVGTGALNASVSQVGENLQLNFNASLAGGRSPGSALIEVTLDLTQSGTVAISGQSISLNSRAANVSPFEPVTFEVLPPIIARDDSADAVQDGPETSGNVLANDGGSGLEIIEIGGSAANIGSPVSGMLGTLTLKADGSFTYIADNAARLPNGETEQEVFTYRVADSSGAQATAQLNITVTGVNDPASITGTTTGTVTEDDPERQVATGVLSVTDSDAGEDRFADPDLAALLGDYGLFTFDPLTGAWSFRLDNLNSAVLALDEGETLTDTLVVASLDGTATETISVTIEVTGVHTPDPEATVLLQGFLSDRANRAIEGAEVVFTSAEGDPRGAASDASGNFGLVLGRDMSGQLDVTRVYDPVADGRLTASDALDVLRLAVGLAPSWGTSRPVDFIAADFDQDGRVTAADALDVLRAAVGLQSVHQPRWIFLDAEADLSGVDRNNTNVETGIQFDALGVGFVEVSLTGVLLGSMQEYA